MDKLKIAIFIAACSMFFTGCASYYKEPKGGNVAYLAVSEGKTAYSITDVNTNKREIIGGGAVVGGLFGFHFNIRKIDTSVYKTFSATDVETGIVMNTSCLARLNYAIKLEPNAVYALRLYPKCELVLDKLDITPEELKIGQTNNKLPDGINVVKTKADLIKVSMK